MADWKAVLLRRVLASADRLSEAAIRRALLDLKMFDSKSSALLVRATSADQRFFVDLRLRFVAVTFRPPQPWCLKYCTARSCFSAPMRVPNVPRFRRFPVRGSALREYSRYFPGFSFLIMVKPPSLSSWQRQHPAACSFTRPDAG